MFLLPEGSVCEGLIVTILPRGLWASLFWRIRLTFRICSMFALQNNPHHPPLPAPKHHLFIKLALALPAFPVPSCLLLLIHTWGKSGYVANLFKIVINQPLIQIKILENQAGYNDMANHLACIFWPNVHFSLRLSLLSFEPRSDLWDCAYIHGCFPEHCGAAWVLKLLSK